MSAPLDIVDTHVHVWNQPRAAAAHTVETLSADELSEQMAGAGVSAAVLVTPSWEGFDNDTALAAARAHPDRFAVLGRLDLDLARESDVLGWRETPGMLGVRLIVVSDRERAWLTTGTADWFWAAAERAELPVTIYAPDLLVEIGKIAVRHPALRLVVEHFGLALDVRDEAITPALDPVVELAQYPSVAVKASALPCYLTRPYPFDGLRAPLRRILDAYGAERVMWGSDLTRLPCPYVDWVRVFFDAFDFLTERDRALVMSESARLWLGWT